MNKILGIVVLCAISTLIGVKLGKGVFSEACKICVENEKISDEEYRKFEKDFAFITRMLNERDIEIYKLAIERNKQILNEVSNVVKRVANKTRSIKFREDNLLFFLQENIREYECYLEILPDEDRIADLDIVEYDHSFLDIFRFD